MLAGGGHHASFGVFDDKKWAMTIYRVAYRYDKTADKIRAAGLPAPLSRTVWLWGDNSLQRTRPGQSS